MNFKTTILATTAAFVLAGAASAATLAPGDLVLENNELDPGEGITYEYTASADLRVLDFVSVSSVGFNEGDDLVQITFGYTSTDVGNVSSSYAAGEINTNGATTEADSTISGFTLLAGQSFTFFFEYADGGADFVSNQFNFQTEALASVPLPAGFLLLGTALGGLGLARRRSTKKA